MLRSLATSRWVVAAFIVITVAAVLFATFSVSDILIRAAIAAALLLGWYGLRRARQSSGDERPAPRAHGRAAE